MVPEQSDQAPDSHPSGGGKGRDDRAEAVVGRVSEMLPNRQIRVVLARGDEVVAHLAGSMRVGVVRLLCGDLVRVERSPFDGRRARIVGRASVDEAAVARRDERQVPPGPPA